MKNFYYLLLYILLSIQSVIYAQVCSSAIASDQNNNLNPYIDCNYIFGNPSKCIDLKVEYPSIKSTSGYTVEPINFNGESPYGAFNTGTALNANADDQFFAKVDIPFQFCFFNKVYSEVVIGSNGVITFNENQLGNDSYPNFDDTDLNLNSIFAGMSDMVFSDANDSEIYYSIVGTAPCRKLIINFYKGRLSNCQESVTSQIVLHEGTNEIEVFIKEKPLTCATGRYKQSVIGIKDSDAFDSTTIFAPNRQTGIWSTTNEAWKFVPNGEVIQPKIQWFDEDNNVVGAGSKIQVCPKQSTQYTVKVAYDICGNNFELVDQIPITFAPEFPISKDFSKILCGESNQTINLADYHSELVLNPSLFKFRYFDKIEDANAGINDDVANQIITGNRNFYVRVQNPTNENCFIVSTLNFTFINTSLLTDLIKLCDLNADGVEKDFKVNDFRNQLVNRNFNGVITYFSNETHAQNNTNPITTLDLYPDTKFWIRMETPSCINVSGPINIQLTKGPNVPTSIDYLIDICDINDNKQEIYDFSLITTSITTDSSLEVRYYASFDQAYSGTGTELERIKDGEYKIFARTEFLQGCFSVTVINLTVEFSKVIAINKNVDLCFDGTQDMEFKLSDLIEDMLNDEIEGNADNIEVSFYDNPYDADEGGITPRITDLQKISEDGNWVKRTYYVRFERAVNCYTVRTLTVTLVHPVPVSQVDVCDHQNNSQETITLANYNVIVANGQNVTVSYFETEDEAINNVGAKTSITINGNLKLFVKLTYKECFTVYPVDFKLVETPEVTPVFNYNFKDICDNNNDGSELIDLTQFESNIYSGSKNVRFQYFTTYNSSTQQFSGKINNPTQYKIEQNSTVYAKVEFNDKNACFSVSTININAEYLPAIVLKEAKLEKCSYDSSASVEFDLREAIPQLFNQTDNVLPLSQLVVEFFRYETNANARDLSDLVPTLFIAPKSLGSLWVRFTDPQTNCYSVKEIFLQTYLPPKTTLQTIIACDRDFDGFNEVNLMDYKDILVLNFEPYFIYNFFLSKEQANDLANGKPILNPENYKFNEASKIIYLRVESIAGCFSVTPVQLVEGPKIQLQQNGPFTINDICDSGNDGIEIIDLRRFEAVISQGATFKYYRSRNDISTNNIISNPSAYSFDEHLGSLIFVSVEKPGLCPELVEINVTLKESPIFIIPETFVCPFEGSVDIIPDFSGLQISSYEWKDAAGQLISKSSSLHNVTKAGNYSIKVVGDNGCDYTVNFAVTNYDVPVITDLIPNGNTYKIVAKGDASKIILYSKDKLTWQTSDTFTNLPAGNPIFYVKYENESCIGFPKEGIIPNIFNVITPNADGQNDIWKLTGLHVFDGKNSSVKIFDRYQKLLYEQTNNVELSWNGHYLGRPLSTDSYWYVISLPDGRIFTGWILLKNRN